MIKCKCCNKTGEWTIPSRNGKGFVCKKCYDFVNAPLHCSYERLEKTARSSLSIHILDFLYYRRFQLSGKAMTARRQWDIVHNGQAAEGFFGDLRGEFSTLCSIANLQPDTILREIKCLTLERINAILSELGKNTGGKK